MFNLLHSTRVIFIDFITMRIIQKSILIELVKKR